jgi:peroxiredoxin-like protein
MQDLPHRYRVVANAGDEGNVELSSDRLPSITSAAPAEFGGPGDRWSPETLLVGAMADCFILTFRAVAKASKFDWLSLRCNVDGTLDRVDKVTQFTSFLVRASIRLPSGADEEKVRRLLERAEKACLISNSLKADSELDVTVEFGSP